MFLVVGPAWQIFVLLFFLCVQVFAEPPRLIGREIDGHFMMHQIYTAPDGRKYSIIKLSLRERAKMPSLVAESGLFNPAEVRTAISQLYVPSLIGFVEKFVHHQYRLRGREIAVQALQSERAFLDAPATWVVITDENDLSKIHAVGRVVQKNVFGEEPDVFKMWRLGTNPNVGIGDANIPLTDYVDSLEAKALLDTEERLGFRLPELPVQIDRKRGVTRGAWAELKSLVEDRNSPEKFVRLLFYALARDQQHLLPQSRPEIEFENLNIKAGLSELSVNRVLASDHYVLETDRSLIPIYRRLGFKIFQEFPEKKTIVMTINLDDFESKAVKPMSEEGVSFETTVSDQEWTPHPLLPHSAYENYLRDPREAPQFQLGDIELRCSSVIGHLGRIPFIDPSHGRSRTDWNYVGVKP